MEIFCLYYFWPDYKVIILVYKMMNSACHSVTFTVDQTLAVSSCTYTCFSEVNPRIVNTRTFVTFTKHNRVADFDLWLTKMVITVQMHSSDFDCSLVKHLKFYTALMAVWKCQFELWEVMNLIPCCARQNIPKPLKVVAVALAVRCHKKLMW